jgi:ribosomal protein L23
MSRNKAHKKIFDHQLNFAVLLREESEEQKGLIKKLFKSKYGVSPKKVHIETKQPAHRFGVEHLGYVIAPTIAQLEKGKKNHVNYRDFLVIE